MDGSDAAEFAPERTMGRPAKGCAAVADDFGGEDDGAASKGEVVDRETLLGCCSGGDKEDAAGAETEEGYGADGGGYGFECAVEGGMDEEVKVADEGERRRARWGFNGGRCEPPSPK